MPAQLKLGCCSHASLFLLFFARKNLSRLLLGLEVVQVMPDEGKSQKELRWLEGCTYGAVLDCP